MIIRIRTVLTSAGALLAVAVAIPAIAQDNGEARSDAHAARVEEREEMANRANAAADAAQARTEENSEITLRAKEIARAAHSDAFRALMNDMSEGLMNALGVEDEAGIEEVSAAPQTNHPVPVLPVVFVSSSIPLPVLRRYAADVEKTGGAIALRGGVGGLKELGPTVNLIMNILKVDPFCEGSDCDMREVRVIIDPVLFRHAGVSRVPAVAVVDHDPFVSYCERESEIARDDAWMLTYGDASIEGHLEELARRGEKRAAPALAALRSTVK